MALNIKHIADLLQCSFNIPDYQRGYRWESKHINDLLNDLYEFGKQRNKHDAGQFYCLQPLAVIKNSSLSDGEKVVYDVIDGQQRLTTLYLLFSYLENKRQDDYDGVLGNSLYKLKYEKREDSFFKEKKFKNNEDDGLSNIDFFYMSRAYKAIDNWFKEESHNTAKGVILNTLIPSGFVISEKDDVKGENDKLNDARFIWYEVESDGQDKLKSIDVFNSLNYGKTALTSTELVKALLLQKDIYGQDDKLNAEKTFRRSCEWDEMEKGLKDHFFWSMLCPSDKNLTEIDQERLKSHISLILYYVCQEIDDKCRYNQEDENYTFLVCNDYLGSTPSDYAKKVDLLWKKIQTVYTMFHNWYVNRNIYHLVGLFILLDELEHTKKENNLGHRIKLLQELVSTYTTKSRSEFEIWLKGKIGEKVEIREKTKNESGERKCSLTEINYEEHPDRIIKILLLFNVDLTMKKTDENEMFSFKLFREFKITSLEHIHPQHLSMDSIEGIYLKEWANVKRVALEKHAHQKGEELSEEKKNLFDDLDRCIDSNGKVKDIKRAQEIAILIDKDFDDLSNMKPEQMHTLYNMALVDKDTNAALGNKLLDEKRNILMERAYKTEPETYLLLGTKKVFCKEFSKDVELPKLWTKPDREYYFQEIEKVYNEYVDLANNLNKTK